MTWTDQKIQMLKEMWGHGYSASEIAARLGGLTRNAVIGKAHRLKLSAGLASTKRGSAVAAPLPNMVGGNVLSTMKSSRKRVMLRPLPVVPTPAVPTKNYTKEILQPTEPTKRSEGIAVTKAGERHCRWPVGDPRSPDFRFCGCNAHEGLPYCIEHARVAYQNIGKRQRAASSDVGSGIPSVEQIRAH